MTGLAIRIGGDVSGLDKAMSRATDIVSTRGKQMVTTALQTGKAMDTAFGTYRMINLAAQNSTALTSSLRGVAVALGTVAIGIGIIKGLQAATAAAAEQVERLVKIGDGARAAGVSTSFYQQWAAQARSLKVESEDLAKSLERLKAASIVKQGEGGDAKELRNESSLSARLRQQMAAGNIDQSGLNRFLGAGDTEQRLRVLLDLMQQLIAKGRMAAAMDIGGQFLAPNLLEGIRSGSIEIDRLKAKLNDVKSTDVRIFEDQDIENAQEMKRRLDDAYRIISNDLKPIYDDFAAAGRDFYSSTVSWVEALAGGVRLLAQAYEILKGAGGLADGIAKSIGNSGVANSLNNRLKEAFPDSYNDKNDTAIARQLREAEKNKASLGSLAEKLGGGPGSEKALADLAARMNPTATAAAQAKSRAMTDGFREDQSKPIVTGTGRSSAPSSSGGADRTSSVDRYVQSLERARDIAKAEAETAGLGNVAKEKAVALVRAQAAAQRDVEAGLRNTASLTDAEVTKIEAAATATAKWKEEAKAVQDQLEFVQSLAGDALKGFIGDLKAGKSFADALKGALDRISTKILDKLIDGLIGGLFSGGSGGFSIFKLFGFAEGGHVSGPGTGRSDSIPARLSNGEFVVNARATAQNREFLEAINSGRTLKFADGGAVGGVPIMVPSIPDAVAAPERYNPGATTMNAVNQNVTVNVTGGSSGDAKADQKFAELIGRKVQEQMKSMIGNELRQQLRPGGVIREAGR